MELPFGLCGGCQLSEGLNAMATINFIKQLEQRRKEALEGGGDVEEEGGGIGTKLRRLASAHAGEKLSVGEGLLLVVSIALVIGCYSRDMLLEEYFRKDEMAKAEADVAAIEQKISAQRSKLSQYDGIQNDIRDFETQAADFNAKIKVIKSVRYGRNSIVRMVDQVVQSIPDAIWMSKVQIDIKGMTKGAAASEGGIGELKIDGYSKNFQEVSKFLGRLEGIYFFKNWKLEQSETDPAAGATAGATKDMVDSKKFSINAKVERAI